MRDAVAVGADRAQQERDRAAGGRLVWSVDACCHGRRVSGAVLRTHHPLHDHRHFASQGTGRRRLQIGEGREDDHVSGKSRRRRRR